MKKSIVVLTEYVDFTPRKRFTVDKQECFHIVINKRDLWDFNFKEVKESKGLFMIKDKFYNIEKSVIIEKNEKRKYWTLFLMMKEVENVNLDKYEYHIVHSLK